MKKVFAVILHYGDKNITLRCIGSIINTKNKLEEIVVVDNTNQFKVQSSKFKVDTVKIVRNRKNLGYAGGMNVGIKYALSKNADYVLLLNNDVIFEEEILSKLVKFLESKKDVGIVAPAIKFQRNGKMVYDLGGKVNKIFGRTSHFEVNKDEMLKRAQHDNTLEVDYISGCCMLIKKEVFEKIGLFDENFFLYYEDVDFCLRAGKENFNTYILSSCAIKHELSKSVGENSSVAIYNQTRSALLFGQKYFGIKKPLNFLFVFLQSFVFLAKNSKSGAFAFYAIFNFLKEKK